jgi:hypothetical protein
MQKTRYLIDGTSGFPLGGRAMPSLEAASNATDIANILFIGTLLACIVLSVAVASFVGRRDGIDSPETARHNGLHDGWH